MIAQSSFLILLLSFIQGWECGGGISYIQSGPHNIRSLFVRSSTQSPPRIHYSYQDFGSDNSTLDNYIKIIIIKAVNSFFTHALKVYPIASNLIIPINKCGNITVPLVDMTIGIPNTDIIVYITSDNSPDQPYIIQGGPCAFDSNGGNIIAGSISINSQNFKGQSFDIQMSSFIHQMTHLLGFINSLFNSWRKNDGSLYTEEELIQNVTIRGANKRYLATPNVMNKSREAFGCSSLIGMELEDIGQNNTSHWSGRIMYNDYMIAHVSENLIYSTISLAALEDTGWYSVNYSIGQVPIFGRNLGCNFINSTCLTNGISNFPDLFCNTLEIGLCDPYLLRKAGCFISQYSTALPVPYEYFSNPFIGGSDYTLDYCPINVGFPNGDCRGVSLTPTYVPTTTGESVGSTSRCIQSTLYNASYNAYGYYSGCYPVINCTSTGANILVANHMIFCPFTGGNITVEGFNGYLICPNSSRLCNDVPCMNGCYGSGICASGQCQCYSGYSGADCSIMCSMNCEECNMTECLICNSGSWLSSGVCIAGINGCLIYNSSQCALCQSGYFLSEGYCCVNNCISCARGTCLNCSIGNALINEWCCPLNCDICINGSCNTCIKGYIITNYHCCPNNCFNCINGICFLCNIRFTLNNGMCCPLNCHQCSNGICMICERGHSLTNNFCCPKNCDICVNGACISCITGVYLSNGICYPVYCISYFNGICYNCSQGFYLVNGNCYPNNCILYSNGNCRECNKGYLLNDAFCCPINCETCKCGTCIQCRKGYVLAFANTCCPIGCSIWKNSACLLCNNGYSLVSGLCCPNNCNVCITGYCIKCNINFTLDSGACY